LLSYKEFELCEKVSGGIEIIYLFREFATSLIPFIVKEKEKLIKQKFTFNKKDFPGLKYKDDSDSIEIQINVLLDPTKYHYTAWVDMPNMITNTEFDLVLGVHDGKKNIKNAYGVLLHELQHIIQTLSGHFEGQDKKYGREVYNSKGSVAQNVDFEHDELSTEHEAQLIALSDAIVRKNLDEFLNQKFFNFYKDGTDDITNYIVAFSKSKFLNKLSYLGLTNEDIIYLKDSLKKKIITILKNDIDWHTYYTLQFEAYIANTLIVSKKLQLIEMLNIMPVSTFRSMIIKQMKDFTPLGHLTLLKKHLKTYKRYQNPKVVDKRNLNFIIDILDEVIQSKKNKTK